MGRRGRTAPRPGAYLGDTDPACHKIERLMQRTVTAMTEYTPSFQSTVEMLFSPDTVERATRAQGIVVKPHSIVDYKVGTDISLSLDYSEASMVPIARDRLALQQHDKPLRDHIHALEAIYLQFEEVKALVRWFNQNATLKAIRYYWPTIMGLFPDLFADMQEVPTTFATPHGIHGHMQMVRDTATTMAAARLLSETIDPRKRHKMWLTFNPRRVKYNDAVPTAYLTDQVIINL